MNIYEYVMLQLALGNKTLNSPFYLNQRFIFIVQTNLFIVRDSKKLYPVLLSTPHMFTDFWNQGKYFVHKYEMENYNLIGFCELFDNPDEFLFREKHSNNEITYSVQRISEWMRKCLYY